MIDSPIYLPQICSGSRSVFLLYINVFIPVISDSIQSYADDNAPHNKHSAFSAIFLHGPELAPSFFLCKDDLLYVISATILGRWLISKKNIFFLFGHENIPIQIKLLISLWVFFTWVFPFWSSSNATKRGKMFKLQKIIIREF